MSTKSAMLLWIEGCAGTRLSLTPISSFSCWMERVCEKMLHTVEGTHPQFGPDCDLTLIPS